MTTNFEFYKDKILEIIGNKMEIAVVNNRPVPCEETNCDACDFRGFCSEWNLVVWLYAEHIEKPKLTKRERAFCEAVQTGWIARDEGYLYWHIVKPIKDGAAFIFPNSEDSVPMVIKTKGLAFDVIKNKEMMAVAYLLEMEVQHETD